MCDKVNPITADNGAEMRKWHAVTLMPEKSLRTKEEEEAPNVVDVETVEGSYISRQCVYVLWCLDIYL